MQTVTNQPAMTSDVITDFSGFSAQLIIAMKVRVKPQFVRVFNVFKSNYSLEDLISKAASSSFIKVINKHEEYPSYVICNKLPKNGSIFYSMSHPADEPGGWPYYNTYHEIREGEKISFEIGSAEHIELFYLPKTYSLKEYLYALKWAIIEED